LLPAVKILLRDLPPGQRRVAESLVQGDGRTYREVAADLQLSGGTVKN
jgi:DNA-directed RNA polymerase specialized sigma24 family protein